jgi:glycosyltransferase involved in cell wall biosynthesis
MDLSVIICTHNPRSEYILRALEALRLQTLPMEGWELLLIDNASTEPLASRIDLSWHPNGRHIPEGELGLTPARLCGIAQARGNLLVFVDDDNILDRNYLEVALRISASHPFLGAFGGSIEAEFEVEPNPRFHSLLHSLAIREVKGIKWANFGIGCLPFGAGLCVTRKVAQTYAVNTKGSKIRRCLGRRGESLMGGEDLDLAMTSYDLGMGVGLFGELTVTHLIEKRRLSPRYLRRVSVEGTYSLHIVRYLHGELAPRDRGKAGLLIDSLKQMIKTFLGRPSPPAEKANREAERRAARDIRLLQCGEKIALQQK